VNIYKWLKNKKIGVLYGGLSAERKISILSGRAVYKALYDLGLNVTAIDAGREVASALRKNKIDFAYLALHGPYGEDGKIQGLLEVMGIPYTGCGVLSSAICMNKIYTKRMLDALSIPTPGWFTAVRGRPLPPVKNFPVVVKPSTQGSAIGVSIAKNRNDLNKALWKAFKYDREVIVEKYIKGVEITVGILGGKALPVIEIVPANEFYDFESKYKPGCSRHLIPPRLPKKTIDAAKKLALKTFNALGSRAVARIDMIVDQKKRIWVLESNTIPGMTETSLLPDAAKADGLNFSELILQIIKFSVA
jgi:D-alanine-D-alanine ligase